MPYPYLPISCPPSSALMPCSCVWVSCPSIYMPRLFRLFSNLPHVFSPQCTTQCASPSPAIDSLSSALPMHPVPRPPSSILFCFIRAPATSQALPFPHLHPSCFLPAQRPAAGALDGGKFCDPRKYWSSMNTNTFPWLKHYTQQENSNAPAEMRKAYLTCSDSRHMRDSASCSLTGRSPAWKNSPGSASPSQTSAGTCNTWDTFKEAQRTLSVRDSNLDANRWFKRTQRISEH